MLFTAFALLAACATSAVATPFEAPAPAWFTTITTSSDGHATTLTTTYDSPTPTSTTTVPVIATSFDKTVTPTIDPFPTDSDK